MKVVCSSLLRVNAAESLRSSVDRGIIRTKSSFFFFPPTSGAESKFLKTKCLNWPTTRGRESCRLTTIFTGNSRYFRVLNSPRFCDRYHANDTLFSHVLLPWRVSDLSFFSRVPASFFSRVLHVHTGHCHGFDAVFLFFFFLSE